MAEMRTLNLRGVYCGHPQCGSCGASEEGFIVHHMKTGVFFGMGKNIVEIGIPCRNEEVYFHQGLMLFTAGGFSHIFLLSGIKKGSHAEMDLQIPDWEAILIPAIQTTIKAERRLRLHLDFGGTETLFEGSKQPTKPKGV